MGLNYTFNRRDKEYPYTLVDACSFQSHFLYGLQFNNEWCSIENGLMTVFEGYSWDGCSPKWRMFGRWVGAWDGRQRRGLRGSVFHDPIYQFMEDIARQNNVSADRIRLIADEVALQVWRKDKFQMRRAYYPIVRMVGGAYHNLMKGRDRKCSQ